MTKVPVRDLQGNVVGEIDLPSVFQTEIREDLIKRAVLAEQSWNRQPYGTDKLAGKRTSAHYHGRRRSRYAMICREMARIPRIHGRGAEYTPLYMEARVVPQARKGRRAHPPKVEKKWAQKINKKEYKLALKSAIAACACSELVKQRGHRYDGVVPIVVVDDFENLNKTKDVEKTLLSLGLEKELQRAKQKKIRAGRGKMRGRRYKRKKSLLIVTSSADCNVVKAARNLPGVDVASYEQLNANLLAPGAHPGRLMLITQSALKKLGELYG